MQMCLLYIFLQSQSLGCPELPQHVSHVKETSVLSGNSSDKQTRCYDISKRPKHGKRWWGVEGAVAGGEGGEAEPQKVDLFTQAHAPCSVRSAESKMGFL